MKFDLILADRIRLALAHISDVEEKKMFNGITFMVNGKMCVGVSKDRLMCRINPENHNQALAMRGVLPVEMKGRPYVGYIYVEPAALGTDEDLRFWIDQCLLFNPQAKASKKRKGG